MAIDVRPVGTDDLELICRHRAEMFVDAGIEQSVVATMTENFREWLEPRLADGSYFGFVALADDYPVASIGLMVISWPPHPLHPTDERRGYILNMFVEPYYRRRGMGADLMGRADEEFRARDIGVVVLHATDKGQKLYKTIGWNETSEMVKRLSS
jgi:GNAT superfamily N-acetyltransferase